MKSNVSNKFLISTAALAGMILAGASTTVHADTTSNNQVTATQQAQPTLNQLNQQLANH
ncbi:hypothetical protein H9564_03660 [Limosilactobacillus sp. Sa3CUN2]|uniref:Uncharacterized protein n=1 Tax=Limosilactobacillus avistercoris TaxID=2762243 RepID=A0ABR8PC47_9LACO|nr:hypothetical protein [Limosilactobacillus avistercoris]MBD7894818.1 hypothetical protein [Limosilactobacillus avistercoris]